MVRTHSLPIDTNDRVRRSLLRLGEFPQMGPALAGAWDGYRFILGPWPWMVLVYEVLDGAVFVVTIQDARSSAAASGSR